MRLIAELHPFNFLSTVVAKKFLTIVRLSLRPFFQVASKTGFKVSFSNFKNSNRSLSPLPFVQPETFVSTSYLSFGSTKLVYNFTLANFVTLLFSTSYKHFYTTLINRFFNKFYTPTPTFSSRCALISGIERYSCSYDSVMKYSV